jgi:3-dehydroquinate dehydratase I
MAQKASLAFALGTDYVEFRIDRLRRPSASIAKELSRFARKCVITVRSGKEGGSFAGGEGERLELISRLARMRPAYLDVELSTVRANAAWWKSLPRGSKRIVSWHDFKRTPGARTLKGIRDDALKAGDVAKLVSTATKAEDNLTMLSLCAGAPGRVIAFCMGEKGAISRVLSLRSGSPLVYAALPNEAVAPGQLSITTMKRLKRLG